MGHHGGPMGTKWEAKAKLGQIKQQQTSSAVGLWLRIVYKFQLSVPGQGCEIPFAEILEVGTHNFDV